MNKLKIPAITTEQMIEVDRLMLEEYGIQLIQMMENAGRNLADFTRSYIQKLNFKHSQILVLCGAGNNGGGAMVAARHLHNRGFNVKVRLIGEREKLKTVPKHQWQIIEKLNLALEEDISLGTYDLILDAIIGYGLIGNPRPPVSVWIERINASGKDVIALDAPSGLNTSTGKPGKPCIRADATLTLALPKTGLLAMDAKAVVGQLFVADIGVPPELYESMNINVPRLFKNDSIVNLS